MMRPHMHYGVLLVALAGLLLGCAAQPTEQLERVAKDWALTIRASQIIPVYPLSEDVQPGDVLLVPASISQQTEIYEAEGFLPIDQLVTRLQGLDFERFYKNSYWAKQYAESTHQRPNWPADGSREEVLAPRAAFPTYTFSVQRGGGVRLAIPVHGVPVGLGLMGAERAAGTITIKDAYSYGIDGESLVRALHAWLDETPAIRGKLQEMARISGSEIYLRIVSRVYLTRGVLVTLTNLDSAGAGADVGFAQSVSVPDLSDETSAAAYANALEALSGALNKLGAGGPGGSLRVVQASRRSVTMDETFDRPLVIGYAGFDVRVFGDGSVSPPIPSFSVVSGQTKPAAFVRGTFAGGERSVRCVDDWINADVDARARELQAWWEQQGLAGSATLLINTEEFADARARFIREKGIACDL